MTFIPYKSRQRANVTGNIDNPSPTLARKIFPNSPNFGTGESITGTTKSQLAHVLNLATDPHKFPGSTCLAQAGAAVSVPGLDQRRQRILPRVSGAHAFKAAGHSHSFHNPQAVRSRFRVSATIIARSPSQARRRSCPGRPLFSTRFTDLLTIEIELPIR